MKNSLPLLICCSVFLASCGITDTTTERQRPFVFNRLVLRQEDSKGNPLWELQSPKSRYQMSDRVSIITKPIGTTYKDGKPTFRIYAPKAHILSDGDLIELLDGVTMRALDDSGQVIRAENATWKPQLEMLFLNGNPVANNHTQQISSDSATYSAKSNELRLSNNVVLRSWDQKIDTSQKPGLTVYSQNAFWNTNSGEFTATGPISGYQRNKDDPRKVRLLSASSLRGNSKAQWIDFLAPVTVKEPIDNVDIKSGDVRWWIEKKQLVSDSNVSGTFKQAESSGKGLVIFTEEKQIQLLSDCSLSQPGETLTASKCFWNWDTGAVLAQGDVELKRDEMNQVTRAQQLQGIANDEGRVVFTAPGEQVQTQLEFKNQDAAKPSQGSSGPPVQF